MQGNILHSNIVSSSEEVIIIIIVQTFIEYFGLLVLIWPFVLLEHG